MVLRYRFYKRNSILVGIGALAYCGLLIQKDARQSRLSTETYQRLPAEIRKYDNSPRDGYLDAGELKRYFENIQKGR